MVYFVIPEQDHFRASGLLFCCQVDTVLDLKYTCQPLWVLHLRFDSTHRFITFHHRVTTPSHKNCAVPYLLCGYAAPSLTQGLFACRGGRSHTQVERSSTRLRRDTHNVPLLSHRAHEQVSSTLRALRESFFHVLGIDLRCLGFYRLQDLFGDGLGALDGRRTG